MPERPRVLIIGDSISMGYHDVVVSALRDVADVTRVPENGRWSANILEYFDAWVPPVRPNVVHLNCGLHDIIRRPETNMAPRTALDTYIANVREIVQRIRSASSAEVIWGSTTPTNSDVFFKRTGNERRDADVHAYNSAAAWVMRELNVPITDLFSVIDTVGRNELLKDGVHFIERGSQLLGTAVANSVRKVLVAKGLVGK